MKYSESDNFITVQIPFRTKTRPLGAKLLESQADYCIWYAKDKKSVKYRQLFSNKNVEGNSIWKWVELPNGQRRKMSLDEVNKHSLLPKGSKVYRTADLRPAGFNSSCVYDFEFEGRMYKPPGNGSWITNKDRMRILAERGYLQANKNNLERIIFLEDFPIQPMMNLWVDSVGSTDKRYVVQTSNKIIQNCILMTTDPGDLVLDPTCGSGTTAYVAEQWGRRWVTCDTSRVSIALAKQRLMTSIFDYYELARPNEGVSSGFKYKTVPHITLASIANNESFQEEILYDQPIIDKKRKRVSGPFTVEAVPSQRVTSFEEAENLSEADATIARSGETIRQNDWIDEMLVTGVRGKGGQKIEFSRMEPLGGTRYVHAEAETKNGEKTVISFGPKYAPLEQRQIELAIQEAQKLVPKPKIVLFASFQFDPEAAKDVDELKWPGVTILKIQMNTDLLTSDLKKNRSSNDSFWLMGQPDVEVIKQEDKFVVRVNGFDYYNSRTGEIESGDTSKIAMWELDTDYDGRSLYPRQVFFPMAGKNDGWDKLAKTLRAVIDEKLIEQYKKESSIPFKLGENKRVAVKIIDDRGIESLKIIDVKE